MSYRFPPVANQNRRRIGEFEKTKVRKGVSIVSNAAIFCGIEIGENAIIAAGSFVTKSVGLGEIVYGHPAKPSRK